MENNLRRIQLIQLEILMEIDKICRANYIKYSLCGGTLLGAIRHKGFIPWDDDLDVCMSRLEYDRFLKIWSLNPPNGYVLQNKDNTPDFVCSFSKIRKNHSTFIQHDFERNKYHTGIFVDVFPFDRLPPSKVTRKFFLLRCLVYQLYTKEFIPPEGNSFEKKVAKVLLCLSNREKRNYKRKKLEKRISRLKHENNYNIIGIQSPANMKLVLPNDLFDELIEIEFEGKSFYCFKKWDQYLRIKYGDYMALPPEKDRTWMHHPIIIDFEHNYEELTEQISSGK